MVSDKRTAVIIKGRLKTLKRHLWSATLFFFPNYFPDIFTESDIYFFNRSENQKKPQQPPPKNTQKNKNKISKRTRKGIRPILSFRNKL